MPWRRRNEQGASSIDGKASARGEGSGATDQFCIVTLTLLPAHVVATMPAYRPNLLVPARSWRTWPTLEPFHQRPFIAVAAAIRPSRGSGGHRPLCRAVHIGRYAQCSVMCRARTQQGCRPRECWRCGYPGRSCAAHNVCFLARRTEGKQSCHAVATDTMTIAHRPHRIRPFVKVSPRQGPSNARDSNRSPHGWR